MHVIQTFLGWPDGSIWGNLFASVVIALPAWMFGYFRLKKQHSKAQAAIHRHIAEQFTKLTEKIDK